MSPPPPPNDFAARLREVLRRRGISHTRLAGMVPVSENTVTSWAKGRYRPGHRNLVRIAAVLGVTLDELHDAAVPTEMSVSSPQGPRADEGDGVARSIVEQLAGLQVDAPLEQLARATPDLMRLLADARRHAHR